MQEVIVRCPAEWHTPLDLDVGTSKGTRSLAVQKRKEAAKQVVENLAAQRKKEAAKKARMEKERTSKEHAKKE